MYVGGICGCFAGRIQVGDGDLDVDGTDFVGPCVFGKRRYRIDLVQIVRHLLRVGGLLGLCCGGSHRGGSAGLVDIVGRTAQFAVGSRWYQDKSDQATGLEGSPTTAAARMDVYVGWRVRQPKVVGRTED